MTAKKRTGFPPGSAHDELVAGDKTRREIIIAHDPAAGPVTAVKNILLQASLAQLKVSNHYERYASLIAPDILNEVLLSIGPGWIPIEVALAHYQACEDLNLDDEQMAAIGGPVGERVQEAALVSRAKKVRDEDVDVWTLVGQLHRMWARVFQGGSVQVTRVGPKDLLIEERGFVLTRFRYFRQAQLPSFPASFGAVGIRLTCVKIERYSPARDELVFRIAWG